MPPKNTDIESSNKVVSDRSLKILEYWFVIGKLPVQVAAHLSLHLVNFAKSDTL